MTMMPCTGQGSCSTRMQMASTQTRHCLPNIVEQWSQQEHFLRRELRCMHVKCTYIVVKEQSIQSFHTIHLVLVIVIILQRLIVAIYQLTNTLQNELLNLRFSVAWFQVFPVLETAVSTRAVIPRHVQVVCFVATMKLKGGRSLFLIILYMLEFYWFNAVMYTSYVMYSICTNNSKHHFLCNLQISVPKNSVCI